jgi:2-alkyl-3-oxoalkanoate reductase
VVAAAPFGGERTTLLLIGGAGHVGTAIMPHLRHAHGLRVLDRAASPVSGVEQVLADAGDALALASAMDGVDAVLHLAAVVPRATRGTAGEVSAAFDVNVRSVFEALVAAQQGRVRSFVHMSTMSVYASYGTSPVDVSRPPDAIHPYGLTKILAENTCRLLSSTAALRMCSLRLAYPTPDEDWPRWRRPSRNGVAAADPVQPRLADGRAFPALSACDLARAVEAALRYQGPYRTFAITGDHDQRSLVNDDTASVLAWGPRRKNSQHDDEVELHELP